jgi:DNA polymerase (family 10)
VGLVINPDAHATGELDYVDYGVAVARKAWLTADDLLNCRGRAEVEEKLETLRARA